MTKPKFDDYPFELRPMTKAEGGGWLITWPDLQGCMSDGETPEEAIDNGKDAFAAWAAVHTRNLKMPMPKPASVAAKPARFVVRAPRSLHARLVERAREEGVSLNSLVMTFIAESLGEPKARRHP